MRSTAASRTMVDVSFKEYCTACCILGLRRTSGSSVTIKVMHFKALVLIWVDCSATTCKMSVKYWLKELKNGLLEDKYFVMSKAELWSMWVDNTWDLLPRLTPKGKIFFTKKSFRSSRTLYNSALALSERSSSLFSSSSSSDSSLSSEESLFFFFFFFAAANWKYFYE